METILTSRINFVDATVNYVTTPADYITLDLVHDYIIWTAGDATVKDLMTSEPTASQLNAAATVISDSADTTVALCLLMDYSHMGGYYTRKVIGMGEDKRYVFCFSLNGATATEPRLEAWDDSDHDSQAKHVLGADTPANSMVKAVCTTDALPGASWVGTAIAGASNYVLLNAGNGALVGAKDLYANIKIVIPTAYATPAVETFVLTIRFTWS